MGIAGKIAVSLIVLALGSCAVLGDFTNDDPNLGRDGPVQFAGKFLVVSDADMAASAYADGELKPIGARDSIAMFDAGDLLSTAEVSNSVISWPQIIDVSPDGQFAFVVESRAPAPQNTTAFDNVRSDFPTGKSLNIFSLADDTLTLLGTRDDIGFNPGSVDYADKSGFVVIATETPGQELTIVGLRWDGSIREVRHLPLRIEYFPNETEKSIRTAHIAPDGVTLAVNIANRRIQFFRFEIDGTGLPVAVQPLGNPTDQIGKRLSVGKWTPDGQFFIVTDTGGSDNAAAMLVQGAGKLTVLAPPGSFGGNPKSVSTAKVGLFPEGFAINDQGTQIVTVDMGRTYLPQTQLLNFWPGRRHYTLTLLSIDPATGQLKKLDQIAGAGLMPEDVIFDKTGSNLAVAVFQRRTGTARDHGYVDFFRIQNERLVSQKQTREIVRGAHDMVRIPG